MKQDSYSLAGVEWSGWPIEDAKTNEAARRYAGFVYVAQFSDGWIKVGCSTRVRGRMCKLAQDAAIRDARIERVFVSRPHDEWRVNETTLISECNRAASAVRGREYFRGLRFEQAVTIAKGLPQSMRTREEMERLEAAAFDGFANLYGALKSASGHQGSEQDVAETRRKVAVYNDWFDPKNSICLSKFAKSVGIESGALLANHLGKVGIFDRSEHPMTGEPRNLPEFKWLHCFRIFVMRHPLGCFVDVAWILPEGQLEIVEELRNNGLIDV